MGDISWIVKPGLRGRMGRNNEGKEEESNLDHLHRLMQHLWLELKFRCSTTCSLYTALYVVVTPLSSVYVSTWEYTCAILLTGSRGFLSWFECLRNYIWETLKNTWYLWTWQNYTLQCDFIIITQFIAQTVVEMLNHDFAQIKACLDIFQNR